MRLQVKKKKYNLTIVIIIVLILIIATLIFIFRNMTVATGGELESSLSETSSISSSTSSIISSKEESSETSSKVSSKDESSSKASSANKSKQPSSENTKKPTAPLKSETKISSKEQSSNPPEQSSEQSNEPITLSDGELPAGNLSDWNLIFLNPEEENKITKELDFKKVEFDYNQCVDSRAAGAYEKMCKDAKQAGITLFLRSGYRSIKTQRVNYNANVNRQINLGYSKEKAIELTNLYYTVPGHSEHHSGLAFDIITPEYHKNVYSLCDKFAQTKAYEWLSKNCSDYGFILRYPKEKQDITTINFEPWHYRYVGIEHAKYIEENNLCFEEYIDLLKQAGR